MPAAEPASTTAAVTCRERCYWTDGHRNDECGRREYLSKPIQKSFFHDDLQRPSERHAGGRR
jgi:hypothetical protein